MPEQDEDPIQLDAENVTMVVDLPFGIEIRMGIVGYKCLYISIGAAATWVGIFAAGFLRGLGH